MFELGLVCFPIRKKTRIPGRLEIDGSGNPKIVRIMINRPSDYLSPSSNSRMSFGNWGSTVPNRPRPLS